MLDEYNIFKHIKEIIKAPELLLAIAHRSIIVKYKQAFLGLTWTLIQPVIYMVIFTIVFSVFVKIPSDDVPYPIFVYCALLPWNFFSGAIAEASSSIVGNASLISKVKIPMEIFPLSSIMARGVDLMISSAILFAMMVYYKIAPGMSAIWVVPLLLVQLLLMISISFFLSAISVYYRDINYALGLVMQIWMFATPVAYPINVVPERYKSIYMINPMATIIDGYRKALLHNTSPSVKELSLIALFAVVAFILSYLFFKKRESTFVDVI